MTHTSKRESAVKAENDAHDFSRLDFLTEVIVHMPLGCGDQMFTHRITTDVMERINGETVSDYITEAVRIGKLQPIGGDDSGHFTIGREWHDLPEFVQATTAMGQFDFIALRLATHHVGGLAQ